MTRIVRSLITVAVLASPMVANAQAVGIDLSATTYDVVRLSTGTPIATSAALISDAEFVVMDAVALVADVGLEIVDPSGQIVTPAALLALGGEISRYRVDAANGGFLIGPVQTPGEHVTLSIPAPQDGDWTLRFSRPPTAPAELAVAITIVMKSRTAASLIARPANVQAGAPVVLTVAAFSGLSPVAGAVAEGAVVSPGGATEAVVFADDGVAPDRARSDGLYTAVFVPAEGGRFSALATLTGTSASGARVRRDTATEFTVTGGAPRLVADAGTDRTVRISAPVALSGAARFEPASGPRTFTFAWALVDGPSVTLDRADTPTPSFTPIVPGVYRIALVARYGTSDSDQDVVVVTVPRAGDVNGDGAVDTRDVQIVVAARNTSAGDGSDVRDVNGDRRIDGLDARVIATLCDRIRCAIQ